MKPIHEMRLSASGRNVVDHGREPVATCFGTHGAELAKAFAGLPLAIHALLDYGEWSSNGEVWHSSVCWSNRRASCSEDCASSREALAACGVDVG